MTIFLFYAIMTLLFHGWRFIFWLSKKEQKWQPAFFGWLGDLFLGGLVCLLALSLQKNPTLYWTCVALSFSILHLYFLIDGAVFASLHLRLNKALIWTFMHQLPSFWHSAKEMGIAPKITGFACVIGVDFFGSFIITYHNPFTEISGYTLALITAIFAMLGLKRNLHLTHPLIRFFIESKQKHLFQKSNLESISLKEMIGVETENFLKADSQYPLLKWTTGFQGEKLFEIKIDQGEKPHILFLFLESFRAKEMGCLGAKKSLTPHLDALAKEGILFSNFYANGALTISAINAALFGVPLVSKPYMFNLETGSSLHMLSIANMLAQCGYEASYMHGGDLSFANQHDFFSNTGFKKIVGRSDIEKVNPEAWGTSWGLHDEYLFDYALKSMERANQSDQPQFLILSTMTNHHPWRAPSLKKPYPVSKYENYCATYEYTDQMVGKFVQNLKKTGLNQKYILFILGDHGMTMGEHENDSHLDQLYEETVHIPLLILADGRIEEPKVVDQLASQIDLLPTVFDLLRYHPLNHSLGSSLMRLSPQKKVFFSNPFNHFWIGCRSNEFKFIANETEKKQELYNLKEDLSERTNLAQVYPELSSELLNQTRKYFSGVEFLYDHKRFVAESIALAKKNKENDSLRISEKEHYDSFTWQEALNKGAHLKTVILHSNQLTRAHFHELMHACNQLKKIDLKKLFFIDDVALQLISQRQCQLEEIYLRQCLKITDQGMVELLKSDFKFTILDVSGSLLLSDEMMQYISLHHTTLIELNLSHLYMLSDIGIEALLCNSIGLTSLNLSGCLNLTAKSLELLTKKAVHLRKLILDLSQIRDEELIEWLPHLQELEEVELHNCPHLTEKGLEELVSITEKLTTIKLKCTPGITCGIIDKLKSKPYMLVANV